MRYLAIMHDSIFPSPCYDGTLCPAFLADMRGNELLDLVDIVVRKLMVSSKLHSDFPSIVCSISPVSAHQAEETYRQDERREV